MRFRSLATASLVLIAQPSFAAERWPYGREAIEAFKAGDIGTAAVVLRRELARCEASKPAADECLDLLLGLSNVAHAAGYPDSAEGYARRALAIVERFLPAEGEDAAVAWNNLASTIGAQGRYAEAEPLLRRSITMREKILPARHSLIAMGWSNLAHNLSGQGRHAEAEPIYRLALRLSEAAFPAGHPSIAANFNSLAANIGAQGRYAEAEPLHRKALALRQAALSPEHPEIVASLGELAFNLNAQHRYVEAEGLYRQALALAEQMRTKDLPVVASIMYNLAYNLAAQRRWPEAKRLLFETVKRRARLPATHRDRIYSLLSMASIMQVRTEDPQSVRYLFGLARDGAMERLRTYSSFDPTAQGQLREFRPIFTGQVRAAWDLSEQAR